ncbi:GNAT family N-acetyltransferase [Vibrio vulnificus]|uniref:GNAT family N-acetyltransferase n=1 Tax=Vibrio vulnificus TaxID=672 RepID=UPI0010297671|nr:GNAT family N-acetyltransferase [Vibrio vulnificus]EGR0130513.1 GNAT family N-acetyltransferase [Vibrio vulnificus]EGR0753589.1 GNAT family N-acetyltransferase [Vibrio vulnificus]RZP84685.1 GNAT family N-acetyltransferase [Vibrio vulnificus]
MIIVREYRESDASELWDIFYNTVHKINICDYSEAQVNAWAPDDFSVEVWQQRMNSISPFVAEIDGQIVGYADLQENGLIDHFFCHYDYQGQGIGRRLMTHVLSVGRSQGIVRFYSKVSITARPFYERFGFNVVCEQTVEIRGQKLKNFVVEKFS